MICKEDWDSPQALFLARIVCFICAWTAAVSILVFDAPLVGALVIIFFIPALAVKDNKVLKFPGAFSCILGGGYVGLRTNLVITALILIILSIVSPAVVVLYGFSVAVPAFLLILAAACLAFVLIVSLQSGCIGL